MLRKTLFWLHLGSGLAAGVLIAIMSFTGAALAFEKDIVAWAERDARRVAAPAENAPRLPLDELVRRARAARPDLTITNITISAEPQEAVTLGLPRNAALCVNPYTGEVREPQALRTRAFMEAMRNWHTRLNTAITPGRPGPGAQLNSAANVVFVFLGLSGLILWWPAAWNARVLRPSLWFNRGARGRARDWNWHNVVGFWSLPLLLVLAGTGVVLSYRWANDLVFRLAGETPPAPVTGPAAPGPATPAPAAPAAPAVASMPILTPDALLATAQKFSPDWAQIVLRFNPPLTPAPAKQPVPKTFSVQVKEQHPWPPFSVNTLVLDAVTGEVKRTDGYATMSSGTRARRWIRLLHSGEALGPFVQFLSGLACLGGCLLVYTGFALSWRRFFSPKAKAATAGSSQV